MKEWAAKDGIGYSQWTRTPSLKEVKLGTKNCIWETNFFLRDLIREAIPSQLCSFFKHCLNGP